MINNKTLDEGVLKASYRKFHTEKDLETFFEMVKNGLVNDRTIKEGIDFLYLEKIMESIWKFELEEHSGDKMKAYNCLKEDISDKILHGWVLDHFHDGRGFIGQWLHIVQLS